MPSDAERDRASEEKVVETSTSERPLESPAPASASLRLELDMLRAEMDLGGTHQVESDEVPIPGEFTSPKPPLSNPNKTPDQ